MPGATATGRSRSARGDAERREARPPRVILVGQRRPEERHEAVAEELVDGALVAVDLGEGGLEELVDEDVHALRPQPLRQRGRADQVAEEHGDGLALALQRAARREDPLGEVARRVGGRRPDLGRGRRRRRGPRPAGGDGVAALGAELRRVRELGAAREAGRREPLAALEAELRPRRILVPTPRTAHGTSGTRPDAALPGRDQLAELADQVWIVERAGPRPEHLQRGRLGQRAAIGRTVQIAS